MTKTPDSSPANQHWWQPKVASPSSPVANQLGPPPEDAETDATRKSALERWAANAAEQPAPADRAIAQIHDNEQAAKHSHRQFVLTILLLSIYTAANASLIVQWFLGHVEAEIAVAAVGNIGVFFGAAVAYYFASKSP